MISQFKKLDYMKKQDIRRESQQRNILHNLSRLHMLELLESKYKLSAIKKD